MTGEREGDGVHRHPHGDRIPASEEERDELVDETIDESFPASDPPSYWGRETSEDLAADGDG